MDKLWLLEARRDLPETDDPWEPWFDKMFTCVVRAPTEEEARELAARDGKDENIPEGTWDREPATSPWLDPHYSTCVHLVADGPMGVVIIDVRKS